jgi:hypothetical protein
MTVVAVVLIALAMVDEARVLISGVKTLLVAIAVRAGTVPQVVVVAAAVAMTTVTTYAC